MTKKLFWGWGVKGEIASSRCPYFLAKNDDLPLKWCIPKKNAKNSTTERSRYKKPHLSEPG
jgi:hypothetical protein